MKKLVAILLVVLMSFALFACGQKSQKGIVIGISKIVAHPALDAVEKGIQDELKALGRTNIVYDLQNANGDLNTAASIANKFKDEKVTIAVGIATPTAQALANTFEKTPVIYAAVTDPVEAGLVKSFDQGGNNITGVSDLTPVKQQIEFLNKLKPIKRLGHIYSSHEQNAVVLAEMAKKACKELGIEFVATTVSTSAEVKQASQSIAGRVDAFYVSTDNTVVSALSALCDVADKHGLPVMSADPSSAEKFPVLAAWGFDYYKMGRRTGQVIDSVLKGKKTSDIPTQFMTDSSDVDLLINLDVAQKLGITIPEEVQKKANRIVKGGKLISK